MPFFQIMRPNLRNSKDRFLMTPNFGTLLVQRAQKVLAVLMSVEQ